MGSFSAAPPSEKRTKPSATVPPESSQKHTVTHNANPHDNPCSEMVTSWHRERCTHERIAPQSATARHWCNHACEACGLYSSRTRLWPDSPSSCHSARKPSSKPSKCFCARDRAAAEGENGGQGDWLARGVEVGLRRPGRGWLAKSGAQPDYAATWEDARAGAREAARL